MARWGLTCWVLVAFALVGGARGQEADFVINPTSGARLAVFVVCPETVAFGGAPALVLVPGGRGDSRSFLGPAPAGSDAERLASLGFVVVAFDPDGRGASEGLEDDNGTLHQDALACVISYAASRPEVDPTRIGLVSYSYGVTMAMGTLARYPELPVLFYIDWEGPATRNDTGGCDADRLGHLQGHPCDDEIFWSEREASTFASAIKLPYLRLQSRVDHVQPDVDHALLLISEATSEAYGGNGTAPWTRLNDLKPNQVYSASQRPIFPAKDLDLQTLVGEFALELLALFAAQPG
ncbi:MAG: hypothetical protein AB1778_05000 [Candidatus Bipolaricaulota bacterium]